MVVSKICTSSVFRSALAAHAGLTATSLLRAVAFSNNDEQLLQSLSPSVGTDDTALDALPWLHQLHNVVVDLYSSGEGMTTTRRTAIDYRQYYGERALPPTLSSRRDDVSNVQLSNNTIFEDPFVCHASAKETERSFRIRIRARPWVNVETILDCIGVEATEDSICGGGRGISNNDDTHPPSAIIPNDATRQKYHPLLVGIIPPTAPKVVVTYKLSQRYGTYLSPFHSIVRVTVQCRNRGCSEQEQSVRHISHRHKGSKEPIPLATSSSSTVATTIFSPRSITRIIVAILATAQSSVTMALARVANETSSTRTSSTTEGGGGTSCHSSDNDDTGHSNKNNLPLVVEIVRMEELWNGLPLIDVAPFHWSRRLNGLVIGCFAYIFCD